MTTHASTDGLTERATADHADAAGAARASRSGWALAGVVWLAATLVFWLFDALPFMDLPAHAGLIALRHRFESSPFEQQYFVLASNLGPYSLFRFLGEGFDRLLGPTGAVRALATLPVLATPAALYFARRRLHGDRSPTAIFFGVALSFGLMTLLGFASYLLGLAVLLFVLTLWLCLMADVERARPTGKRELEIALAAIVLFVAHGHAFVLGLGLMGLTTLVGSEARRAARLVRVRALLPAIALAAYAAWISRQSALPPGSAPLPAAPFAPVFQNPLEKLSLLVTATMTTRTGLDVIAGIVVWALALAAAVRTLGGVRRISAASSIDEGSIAHSRALLWAAGAVGLVFLALPHSIGWFGFVDGRLVPLLLFLLLMAIQRPFLGPLDGVLDRAAPAVATLLVALALAASYRFQDEARGYREVLAHVPARARILNLPLDPNSDVFTAHPFIHYDKLVLAERPIVVSDVWFHQGTALYPTAKNPALRLPASYSESNLQSIDWPAYALSDWDYVLIRTRPEGAPGPLPDALTLEAHEGGWWLFHATH